MPQIQLRGRTIEYTVRVSRRAKRVSLLCSPQSGLEVLYPPGPLEPAPEDLLRQKSDWVIKSMDKLQAQREALPGREYVDGETYMFRGRPHILKVSRGPNLPRIRVELDVGVLRLTYPENTGIERKTLLRGAVTEFYRIQAGKYLPARAWQLSQQLGLEFNGLRIKNQKTRWGSCSAKGNINLNLRLLMTPDEAIDYVIIHELCHLKILNHSAAFWKLVESHCPDYRHWIAWFNQNSASLIL